MTVEKRNGEIERKRKKKEIERKMERKKKYRI
jgi:hypothetical protein